MTEEEKVQRMDDFINNRLSPEAATAFRRELENDAVLAREVEMHQYMQEGIELYGKSQQFRADLHSFEAEIALEKAPEREPTTPDVPLQSGVNRSIVWRWVASIAAILVIGVFAYLWLSQFNESDRLFQAYFQPYPNVLVQSSINRGTTTGEQKVQAMQAYEAKDYQRAAQLLEPLINNNPNEYAFVFYAGIASIQTGQLDKATLVLQKVAEAPNDFSDQATWYLALAYIKQEQSVKAVPYLRKLSLVPGEFQTKATQLLNQLSVQ